MASEFAGWLAVPGIVSVAVVQSIFNVGGLELWKKRDVNSSIILFPPRHRHASRTAGKREISPTLKPETDVRQEPE